MKEQPKHTQGEWMVKVDEYRNWQYNLTVLNEKGQIKSITKEDAEANARRIVFAVNMHDELIDALKSALHFQYTIRGLSLSHTPNTERRLLREKLQLLLKQAEQK